MSRKFLFAVVATVIGGLGFISGCDSSDSPSGPSGNQTGNPGVMVIHAAPDAPAVDLYVDGTRVASNVSYLMNTNYLQLAPGSHKIDITLPGMSEIIYSDSGQVEANKFYSVFAGGLVNEQTFSFYPYEDTLTTPTPSGNARVRFIHMSPDAPPVDVAVDGTVVIQSIAFSEATPFVPYPAGTYALEVRPAGSSTPVLTVPNVSIVAGKIYTIYARGLVSGLPALGASIIANR